MNKKHTIKFYGETVAETIILIRLKILSYISLHKQGFTFEEAFEYSLKEDIKKDLPHTGECSFQIEVLNKDFSEVISQLKREKENIFSSISSGSIKYNEKMKN